MRLAIKMERRELNPKNVDANKVADSTTQHAATIKIKRSAAMSMGFEHFLTHTVIYDLLFSRKSTTGTPYESLYNFKDIKSVSLFAKHFGDLFDKVHSEAPLDDTKCPFTISQKLGTTDFFAELKEDYAVHFPTLEDFENNLTKSTLEFMFVKTLSGSMKQYNNCKDKVPAPKSRLSLKDPLDSAQPMRDHLQFTVCVVDEDCAMQEEVVTIGDKQVTGQKWKLQINISLDASNTQIPKGTVVEISKFSRSNNENFVVKEGVDGIISWKSFSAHYSTFVVPEEATPPVAVGKVDEEEPTPPQAT